MHRRFTGFKPTGHLHLGNYLGAIRPTVRAQQRIDTVVSVVDLHAMTVDHDPVRLPFLAREAATLLLAAGVDPGRTICYLQSQVREHLELHYLLECATSYGEAHRMIQFRERAGDRSGSRLSLLTYPVLMAADILLHDADQVPVGQDQTQHVELARDVARRFNGRYGNTFVVPEAVNPEVAARVMDLSDPTAKMGKTNASQAGVLFLLDPPEVLRRKIMRSVTDSADDVRYEPATRPGPANLLDIMAVCLDDDPTRLAGTFPSYAALKRATADTVIETLRPIQSAYGELSRDPGTVPEILKAGAERARTRAAITVQRARIALGLADL
jgi:tryptophanyl-tRNA synthetase